VHLLQEICQYVIAAVRDSLTGRTFPKVLALYYTYIMMAVLAITGTAGLIFTEREKAF